VDAARRVLDALPASAGGAHGVLTVVRATVARALRKVSTERGIHPSRLVLIALRGADPLHATALARELGCPAVVVPPAPGVLSALGLLLAPPRFEASRTTLADAGTELSQAWEELTEQARAELARQGVTGRGEHPPGCGRALRGAVARAADHRAGR
jgi:N-methylhydantoinase A